MVPDDKKLRLSELENGLHDDEAFAHATLEILKAEKPFSTYTPATAGMALINHWMEERELNCYERGRLVDDVTVGTVFPDENGNYDFALIVVQHGRYVHIEELVTKIMRSGLPLPKVLVKEGPFIADDDLPNEYGYTITGAAIALANKYRSTVDAFGDGIYQAVKQGRLTVRDPRTGLPCTPKTLRDFYERISVADLNKFFEGSGVEYRLDAYESEGIADADESKSESTSLENWKMRVQAEAAKRWKEQRKLGCNPTRHALKDELANWCSKEDVRTTYGINPTADYLYRHVLSKKNWTPPTD